MSNPYTMKVIQGLDAVLACVCGLRIAHSQTNVPLGVRKKTLNLITN
jgi:hypothetical protein